MSCTSFCKTNCKRQHHPVLLSLIEVKCRKSLQRFKQTLKAYQISGFRVELNVPDPDPSFRYPLLHWAAVLEKIDAIKMLIRWPFNLDPKIKSDRNESVLHRLLLFWNVSTDFKMISDLIEILKGCTETVDNKEQTPLHICANYLTGCSKKELEFWKEVLRKMLSVIKEDQKFEIILNHQNVKGETILHILSKREELLDIVEHVIHHGADLNATNNAGETPLEISWRYALPIYNLLHMINSCHNKEDTDYENERRTRASTALSETKDYTEFFNLDDSNSYDEDNYLKRKVSESNISLIQQLENLTTNSQLETDQGVKRRSRKRRVILLSDSDSDDDCELNHPKPLDLSDLPDIRAHNDRLQDELKAFDIQLDIKQYKCEDEILKEITGTIQSIKDMYATDGYDDNDDAEQEIEIDKSMNNNDDTTEENAIEKKIDVIQTFLRRMIT